MAVVGELRDAAVTVYEAADKVRTIRVVQADGLVALTVHVDAQPSLVVVYVHLAAAVGVRDTGEVAVIVVAVARDAALWVDGAVRLHEVRVAVARLVAERVDLGSHKLVGSIAVSGRAARGVGHEVVAFGRVVLDTSLHHAVRAVGMDAPSLAVVFPAVGVAVAVGLLRHQVAAIRHLRGLVHGVGDARHVAGFVVGVRHQTLFSLVGDERQARDASLRVGGGVYRASGRVAHSGEPAVAETELYVKPVGVFYARHAPRAAVPHVEAVCEQAVMAVCLVAFFGAAQRHAFRAHVELAARCYRRESDGTAVLHAEHRHALVLETFHRAVIAAVYAMAQPALVLRIGVPCPAPFQRKR